jgi:hypothetical protein
MDVKKIVGELKKQYPGKNIIINDPDNPTEIICEVEPAEWNPDKNSVVVVFDGKIKHPHSYRKQTYEVLRGILELTKEGRSYFLTEGQKLTEGLDDFHLAKGNETWVKVTSEPAWAPGQEMPFEDRTIIE